LKGSSPQNVGKQIKKELNSYVINSLMYPSNSNYHPAAFPLAIQRMTKKRRAWSDDIKGTLMAT
jgi:hypothetical protein